MVAMSMPYESVHPVRGSDRPMIGQHLEALEKLLAELLDTSTMLRERLSPVLSQRPQPSARTPDEVSAVDDGAAPLAQRIESLRQRALVVRGTLREIGSQVEL